MMADEKQLTVSEQRDLLKQTLKELRWAVTTTTSRGALSPMSFDNYQALKDAADKAQSVIDRCG